jgi:hypothetical protein
VSPLTAATGQLNDQSFDYRARARDDLAAGLTSAEEDPDDASTPVTAARDCVGTADTVLTAVVQTWFHDLQLVIGPSVLSDGIGGNVMSHLTHAR